MACAFIQKFSDTHGVISINKRVNQGHNSERGQSGLHAACDGTFVTQSTVINSHVKHRVILI